MAIRKIARMGHPVLRQVARDLTFQEIKSPEIKRLIQDMIETMEDAGGIGLAAPQIHESIQLAIIGYEEDNERYPDSGDDEGQPLSVFINPKITVLDPTEQGFWEGCLSVPELRGLVYRPKKIQVDYLDINGKPKSLVAENFLATVFQHELDHLAGILYVDRIKSGPGTTPISFTEEYQKYLAPQPDDDIGELED
ncbi:MAG: peptide deformylase [Methylotenera sp.]|nr:peptide deformylase [Oligoflexia bacterium]